jgi:hypothetical protein
MEGVLLLKHASHSSDDGAGGCIVGCVVVGIFLFVFLSRALGGMAPTKMLTSGRIARGILLRVDIPQTRWAAEGGRTNWQRRRIRIDVELPGEAPYEIDDWVQFPTNMSGNILPGATVELRVDPKKKNRVVISGPGVALGAGFFNPTSQRA